jgi:acetyltransferase
VLAILVPQALVDSVAVVQALADVAKTQARGKPLVACLMGEASLGAAYAAAHKHHIPAYPFPEEAITALSMLAQRAQWLATPRPSPAKPAGMHLRRAQSLLVAARSTGCHTVDGAQGQSILQAIGIATPHDQVATSPEAAAAAARQIGFPVVMKLISPDITHKTDVGGVLMGIQNAAAAHQGFHALLERARATHPQARIRGVQVQQMVSEGQEVIVGIKRDPIFGPLVMFGMGGIYAEALADVSFRLAPLSRLDAEAMLGEVRAAQLLTGLRGTLPSDRDALIDALVRVSLLAQTCPEVSELDINPLMVLPEGRGVLAADIRLVLQ